MKIIIAGAGEVGTHLAKKFSFAENEITVIDTHIERLNYLSSLSDINIVPGSPSSIGVLKKAGIASADLFIAVYPSESQDVNIIAAILAKKLGAKVVTARINDEENLNFENKTLFTEMGIDKLFYPEKDASKEIINLLTRTAATNSIDFANGKLQIAEFKIDEDSPIIDMSLQEFSQFATIREEQFRVISITRDNKTIIPKFDSRFRNHDQIFIISKREGIDSLMRTLGKSEMTIRKVMIIGGSHIAEMVARELVKKNDDWEIKIIEKDRNRCMEIAENLPDKVMVINGDGRDSECLLEAGIDSFDAFVALTGSSETNILSCVAAKKSGVGRTIAQVENIEYITLADDMGVDAIINKKLITAGLMYRFTLSDKTKLVKYMSNTNAEILEYKVAPGSRITKGPLKSIDFPKDAIIGGVIRTSEAFIAIGDTTIQAYDRVVVFALPASVREVDKWFKTQEKSIKQNS